MTPEAMITEQQSDKQKPNDQPKSTAKGVEGEAKPTRQAEHKDEKTPAAAQSTATRTESFVFGIPQDIMPRWV